MDYFDYDDEDEFLDELYEDPLSRSLSEIEKSIEDSFVKPDIFESPAPYRPNQEAFGSYASSPTNEYDLGPDERAGLYEVPTSPLRMSGGSRKPFSKKGFPGLFPRTNRSSIRNRNDKPENCPLMDGKPVIVECSTCIHFLIFYEFSPVQSWKMSISKRGKRRIRRIGKTKIGEIGELNDRRRPEGFDDP
jgi:hypothetical protein